MTIATISRCAMRATRTRQQRKHERDSKNSKGDLTKPPPGGFFIAHPNKDNMSQQESIGGSFVCVNCGKNAYRRMSGTNRKKGYKNKYCCVECRVQHAERIRKEVVERIAFVRREIKAIRSLGKATYKPAKIRVTCRKCGVQFAATNGGGLHQSICKACKQEDKKTARRIGKALRRAKLRSVECEAIDPIKVFNRDGWICHICGAKLKPKDRGTYKDKAPELDHIVTLSDGGSHTMQNVACSCRKCNINKGGRSFGQLVLVMAV